MNLAMIQLVEMVSSLCGRSLGICLAHCCANFWRIGIERAHARGHRCRAHDPNLPNGRCACH